MGARRRPAPHDPVSPPAPIRGPSTATSGSGTLAGQRSRSFTASFCGDHHVIGAPRGMRQPGDVLIAVVVVVPPGGHLHLRARRLDLGHEGVGIGDRPRPPPPASPPGRLAGTRASAHQALEVPEAEVRDRHRSAHPRRQFARRAPARLLASRACGSRSARRPGRAPSTPSRHGPAGSGHRTARVVSALTTARSGRAAHRAAGTRRPARAPARPCASAAFGAPATRSAFATTTASGTECRCTSVSSPP